MNLDQLRQSMVSQGATQLYVKFLSPNDNSKNQPYLGGDFSSLNILPHGDLTTENGSRGTRFKAPLNYFWLKDNGELEVASSAQLILYPQYPEVRFSGFLRGCKSAPNAVMTSRDEGRVIFLGITKDQRIIGYAVFQDHILARSVEIFRGINQVGVFNQIPITGIIGAHDADRQALINELKRIHQLGWINSKRLQSDGSTIPCNASNCGGYTLEAELGVTPNGYSEPDYRGWEIKQHSVTNLDTPERGIITLFTPEPTSGDYKEKGVENFIREYGYPDTYGRPDRINFGGVHRYNNRHERTELKLVLLGYDLESGKITDPTQGISLINSDGNEAATWNYAGLIKHWNRKHAHAAYVASSRQTKPTLQYRYGSKIHLGTGTDFLLLLKAFCGSRVYYDPGIKLENASTSYSKIKRRSQFRIKMTDVRSLYFKFEEVDLASYSL
ncbi:MAG: MvaI/BcnI restriction endonuclease family protein [Candidatus Brocadiales bacterium]|nr:MvaI/BcnI restriction endonuclease family protein [Candidatus Brocadiales bacterium]